MPHKQPALAADCVVFDPQGRLLLIRRKDPPFQGRYALPGGFVDYGETTEQAAARELLEETGLHAVALALIGVYSDPHRDPRGHMVSVAYLVRVEAFEPKAGDDAAYAEFVADWQDQALAFDHSRIAADGKARSLQAATSPAATGDPKSRPGQPHWLLKNGG